MKRIFILILTLGFVLPSMAECVYDWDGSSSSSWATNANWSSNPGSLAPGSQVYTIGAPSSYTNAPDINASYSINVDYIDVDEGGQLTISAGTSDVDNDMAIHDGADVNATGGTLTINGNVYIYDSGSSLTVAGCSLIVTGSIFIGLQHPSRGDATNGTPTISVTSGYLSCANLVFDDAEGDTPTMTISGGEVQVSGDVRGDGADVDITISGSGILDINDDLEMDGGSDDLTMTGGTLQIADDWTNSGSESLTGGTIEFNGTGGQNINVSTSLTLYNLTINNSGSGDITLNDPWTISNAATFTDGVVASSSTNYVNFADDATVSGASASSYVDGPVQKTGNDAFVFPIGDGGFYQPITISAPSSASEVFTGRYFYVNPSSIYGWGAGVIGTGLEHVSTREYWSLSRSGSSSISVTIPWNTQSGGLTNISDMRLAHWTGSEWESLGGSVTGNTTAGTITVSSVTSFSPFTLGSSSTENPLPVELSYFKAQAVAQNAELNWKTSSETNNSHFAIERKLEGESKFMELARIQSKSETGNSNVELDYEYVDVDVPASAYYRIRQIDRDGEFEYTDIQYLQFNDQRNNTSWLSDSKVYPNPIVNGLVQVEYSSSEMQELSVNLTNLSGSKVFDTDIKLQDGHGLVELPSELDKGVYFLIIKDQLSNLSQSHRVIVQ